MEKVVICQCEKHKSDLLNSVIDSIKCSQGKSFIWGAGYRGRALLHWLQSINMNITGFIDSDESKIGTLIDGVGVFSSDIVSGETFILISVYDCDDIINSLEAKSINYYDSRSTGIPVLYDKRFSASDNLFFEIQNNLEEDMLGRPIPVLSKDHKLDFFCARSDLYMYKILLDKLRKMFNSSLLRYTNLKGKVVVFDRYNSISDEIIVFLRELGIKAGYVDNTYSDMLNISIDSIIGDNILHYDNEYSFLSYMDVVSNIRHCESYLENLADNGINVYLFRIPNYEELANKSLDEQYRHDNQVTGYSSLKDIQVKKYMVQNMIYEVKAK